jgi:hypothetical protein
MHSPDSCPEKPLSTLEAAQTALSIHPDRGNAAQEHLQVRCHDNGKAHDRLRVIAWAKSASWTGAKKSGWRDIGTSPHQAGRRTLVFQSQGSVGPARFARGVVSPGRRGKRADARSRDARSNRVLGWRGARMGIGRGMSRRDMPPGSQGGSSERGCSDQCNRQSLFGHLFFSIRKGSQQTTGFQEARDEQLFIRYITMQVTDR